MKNNHVKIITDILGDGIVEDLYKSEILKPVSNTVVDPKEMKIALEIVPRSVLTFLFMNLKHLVEGEVIDLILPFVPGAILHINKISADNYSGEVIQGGKKISEFKHRSLPSIGLILLTAFELYDITLLDEIKNNPAPKEQSSKLQEMIEERLRIQGLVQDVVNKKLMEREAINQLIQAKLNDHIVKVNTEPAGVEQPKKKSVLKEFLENREKRAAEYFELDKSEISCPDCKTPIYNGGKNIKLCICYGHHFGKNIKIMKSEEGKIKLKFPKSFDIDNIEMLKDALKK